MANALLIIDMQTGLYDGPEHPFERERVLGAINQLIQRARKAGAPIFVARHTGPAGSPIAAGSPLWQLWHGLEVDAARDHLFNKTRPSCFLGTELAQQLAAAQVDELVVVGMKTQFCIDTTCRVAVELGFFGGAARGRPYLHGHPDLVGPSDHRASQCDLAGSIC